MTNHFSYRFKYKKELELLPITQNNLGKWKKTAPTRNSPEVLRWEGHIQYSTPCPLSQDRNLALCLKHFGLSRGLGKDHGRFKELSNLNVIPKILDWHAEPYWLLITLTSGMHVHANTHTPVYNQQPAAAGQRAAGNRKETQSRASLRLHAVVRQPNVLAANI